MPIPQLDKTGLLPAGIHNCTLAEIAEFFCTNDARREIWDGFGKFLEWIASKPQPSAILVDGSFTTDKSVPSDVDVVIELSTLSAVDQSHWVKAWSISHDWAKKQFSTDFYPVVTHGSDFSAYFQYVKIEDALNRGLPLGLRKGILRVIV